MQFPVNNFKKALVNQQVQLGLWQGLTSAYAAELCATVGYDWLLIDGEHAPNTLQSILAQLQALAAYPVAPVVRPAANDAVELKRLADLGVQNFLIPLIENADQARAAVAAVQYPPSGKRGVAASIARASLWNDYQDYLLRANDEMCVLCQVESVTGMSHLDEILQVNGVDGVFIGPADLSASMGYAGNPAHPEVNQVIEEAITRIRAAGKAAGILHTNPVQAQRYIDLGALFVAVGVDVSLLKSAASQLLAVFREGAQTGDQSSDGVY